MKSGLTIKIAEDMFRIAEIRKLQIDSMASTSQAAEVQMVDKKQGQKHSKKYCGACGFRDNVQQKERHLTSARVRIISPQCAVTSRTNTGSQDSERLKRCNY